MFKNIFSLKNKHIVVSGANGVLGKNLCQALVDFGARLSLIDIQFDQDFLEKLSASTEEPIRHFVLDLTKEDEIRKSVLEIEKSNGDVDVLFSNAATKGIDIDRFFDAHEDFDFKVYQEIISVNLNGMFSLTQAFGSKMASRGRGNIILMGSIYGIVAPDQRIYEGSEYNGRPISTPAVYSVSKAGVIGLAKYLAAYWGSQNIRVNVLVPGGIESGQNEVFKRRYSARVPLNRMGKVDDLIGALIYLASDASGYFTGQTLVVDGGLSVW